MPATEERLEYSVVGDTVNLIQRLQQWGEPGETVLSEPTFAALSAAPAFAALSAAPDCDVLEPATVKGRAAPVAAYRFPRRAS